MKVVRGVALFAVIILIAVLSIHSTAHGQGSIFGGIMTYDPVNQWILFTDQTGTWHAPLAVTNSVAPKDSVVEFSVNTDDQFEAQVYANDTPRSFLDLDPNGTAALYGSAGGGIGVDNNTGDTCIPTTTSTPCGATSIHFNGDGEVSQYLGVPTAGYGIPTIRYAADATLTGSFGPYTIYTTAGSGYGSSGMYRLSGYMTVVGSSGGSNMQFVVDYADEAGLQAESTGTPQPFGSVGEKIPFSFVFYSAANQPITISTVASGGNPVYGFHLRLEQL